LGAFGAGWHRGGGEARMPTLRLANLVGLKHPLSVDTYVEQTLAGAKGILIRLIGGAPYWPYGLQQIEALARRKGLALAVLPADGREDPRLEAISTLPASTLARLKALCDAGGVVAAQAALAQMALAAGLYAGPVTGAKALPPVGGWTPEHGVTCPLAARAPGAARPLAVLTFYRAYLAAADLDPIEALFAALRGRGFDVLGLFAPSLKAPEAAGWLRRQVAALAPAVIVNATSFSGRGADGTSPLDAAGVPVFQVALATSTREAWQEADRGLSPADLAMHVVLPEVDGRIFAGAASFKAPGERDPDLQFARYAHRADASRIAAVADRVAAWHRLSARPAPGRRPALVLSTYPGREWNMAHAVGLDAVASAEAILEDLAQGPADARETPLPQALATTKIRWPLSAYRAALAQLPQTLRDDLAEAWGEPETDPDADGDAFAFAALRRGGALIALQPERGAPRLRKDEYHDLSRTPRHAYAAFYLWLRAQCDALVHIGAHGTLEWLPGKSVALSDACWPEALIGDLPVIYPFIVNDPGEAAQAKRRIAAVTLGHAPPPLRASGTPERLARLEALLDEFSNADGLDPRRRDRLQGDIRDEAQAIGVEDDLGLDRAGCAQDAIARIDRFVCDVKESQFGDGLHVWGRPPQAPAAATPDPELAACAAAETHALSAALSGRR
ncbi:MAG: cobaltochelatase subunit CobN, partial [Pseudomonadota bacterium]